LKKILSLILSGLLALTILSPVMVSAASASASLSGPGTVRAGDIITVSYVINGSGVEGAQGIIQYDSSNLTLTGTSQKIGSPWAVEFFNGANFAAYDNALTNPINGSATLFTMTFKVNSGAATGTGLSVSVGSAKATGGSSDIAMNTATYGANIAAPLSGNTYLSSLSVDSATLSPGFDKNTTTYSTSVPFSVSQLNVNAKAEDRNSKVSVNSPTLTPAGTTAVSVIVTAQSGAKKTYTINATRAQDPNYKPSTNNNLSGISVNAGILSPAFNPDTTSYVVWLPSEVDKIAVTGTSQDSKAKVAVLGGDSLIAGKDNTITVTCTSESGAPKAYTVIAKRAAGNIPLDAKTVQDEITAAGKKGIGSIMLDLSTSVNKQLDKSIFTTLKDNVNFTLNINLGGAVVTFTGRNMTKPAAADTYDLSFNKGSQYKDLMIKAASNDSNAFTYSFAYHGDLPGYATFAISTEFVQGQKVNVYKYDPDKKVYSAIAQGVIVSAGGVVSYINNTCSDYVISTKTIATAIKSDALSKQIQSKPISNQSNTGSVILFAIIALLIGFAGGFITRGRGDGGIDTKRLT
jgi:hypothetical protein